MAHETASGTLCANCGAELQGEYCSRCGQHDLREHGWAFSHFLHEFTHELTHVDSKILRTLKLLLFRPGALTAEYLSGHRVRSFNPIRLYLIITAFYFLFSAYTGFTLQGLIDSGFIKGNLTTGLHEQAQKMQVPYLVVEKSFDEHFHKGFSICAGAGMFIFGLANWVLYRSKDRWLARHLIFALHFYSFLFTATLLWELILHFTVALYPVPPQTRLALHQLPLAAVLSVYLVLALRRVYRATWVRAVLSAVVLMFVNAVIYILALLGGGVFAWRFLSHGGV